MATSGGVRAEMILPHTQPLWKPLRSTCISSARLEGGRSLIMPEIKSLDIWNRVWLISFATPAVAWGANAATTNCYIMFIWAATVSLSGKLSCWKAVVTSSIYWWDIQWLNQIALVLLWTGQVELYPVKEWRTAVLGLANLPCTRMTRLWKYLSCRCHFQSQPIVLHMGIRLWTEPYMMSVSTVLI